VFQKKRRKRAGTLLATA